MGAEDAAGDALAAAEADKEDEEEAVGASVAPLLLSFLLGEGPRAG